MSGSPHLAEPGPDQHASFLEALVEHHEQGEHLDLYDHVLADRDAFLAWVTRTREDGGLGRSEQPRDRVPHRVLWWVDGERYLGRVRINLALNDLLQEFGGHIGYDVRPSARGQGHATALLAASLQLAADHGLAEVLLTCAPENLASVTVIERNGGRLVDTSAAGRLRYWCPTGDAAPAGALRP